ncbi:hypothetical protein TIFTF001_008407 [Ficus carica]|uniref:Uncharacterized protein n=1 Tax=Ficus carica TaxID=3494 RepID=A0AA88AF03_FICCA|nr:hypothetical protein TIFTF001_008407 [Ficus carica]
MGLHLHASDTRTPLVPTSSHAHARLAGRFSPLASALHARISHLLSFSAWTPPCNYFSTHCMPHVPVGPRCRPFSPLRLSPHDKCSTSWDSSFSSNGFYLLKFPLIFNFKPSI